MITSKEKIDEYKKAIKDIDLKSQTIQNELQYLINTGTRNREIEKGTIEYINDLIGTLVKISFNLC